jgi:hypothetical protein
MLCTTCNKPDHSPFRVFEGSKVVMGCVDACHTSKLVTPSESAFWHARPEAKKIRGALQRFLK